MQAIRQHRYRVRFFSTVELVNALELEKQAGKAGQLAARLKHADVVILDDLGYLTISRTGGALLDRLTHHCHIVETGHGPYWFKHSSISTQMEPDPDIYPDTGGEPRLAAFRPGQNLSANAGSVFGAKTQVVNIRCAHSLENQRVSGSRKHRSRG